MTYILAFLLFLVPPKETPEGSRDSLETLPKYFNRIDDGPPLKDQINHDGEGFFVRVMERDGDRDTLSVYIQGVVKGRVKPDRREASKADLVIWCFPSEYKHPNHVFPNAKGRIYLVERRGEIIAVTEKFVKRFNRLPDANIAGL